MAEMQRQEATRRGPLMLNAILLFFVIGLATLVPLGCLVAATVFLVKRRRQIASLIKNHWRTVSFLWVLFISLGIAWYLHRVHVEQEKDTIQEIVFRDAIARFAGLVPPKPGTRYVLYQNSLFSSDVSTTVIHQLHTTVPQVVTGGDPEFYNAFGCYNFEIGDIEYRGPDQINTYVDTNVRGITPTKADGFTRYTLHRSASRWVIAARKPM